MYSSTFAEIDISKDISRPPDRTEYRALPPFPDDPAPRRQKLIGQIFDRHKYSDQSQSLLTRLPPELRRIIWRYCNLWGNQLHIVREKHPSEGKTGRLIGICCSEGLNDFACNGHDCWGMVPWVMTSRGACEMRSTECPAAYNGNRWYKGPIPGTRSTRVSFLPVLSACRWLYSDVIHLIYEENIFCFEEVETLCSFSMRLPWQRLDSIRTVRLTERCLWCLAGRYEKLPPSSFPITHWEAYESACKILASMKYLKHLSIHYHSQEGETFNRWNDRAMKHFKPIIQELYHIQQIPKFEISLYSMADENAISDEEIKCSQKKAENDLQSRTFDIILRRCAGAGICGPSRRLRLQ